MLDDAKRAVDYEERGSGPAVVLVPGSCSTGAAWRPVIAALGEGFRTITTSLPGYGGTAERRSDGDQSIERVAEAVEAVVERAATSVHLVGHSFGGLVAAIVALRGRVALRSLAVLEAPAVMMLRHCPEDQPLHDAFRQFHRGYAAAFESGDREAVGRMIDFYGGAGTFGTWPERVRSYAMQTTAANLRDWQSAFGCQLSPQSFAEMRLPALVAWGGDSHPAAQRANARLAAAINDARTAVIPGARHFMIATHAKEVAELVSQHVLVRAAPSIASARL